VGHDVVIPVVVVTELVAKRSHPELGYFARQALRLLDDLRENSSERATETLMAIAREVAAARYERDDASPSTVYGRPRRALERVDAVSEDGVALVLRAE
jgi:predicted ribonuclease YlaK